MCLCVRERQGETERSSGVKKKKKQGGRGKLRRIGENLRDCEGLSACEGRSCERTV